MCRRAVEIDPNYADAWALIALAELVLRTSVGRQGGDADWLRRNEPSRSIRSWPKPHAVKARIFREENRYDDAEREIEIALRLDSESHQVNMAAALLRF